MSSFVMIMLVSTLLLSGRRLRKHMRNDVFDVKKDKSVRYAWMAFLGALFTLTCLWLAGNIQGVFGLLVVVLSMALAFSIVVMLFTSVWWPSGSFGDWSYNLLWLGKPDGSKRVTWLRMPPVVCVEVLLGFVVLPVLILVAAPSSSNTGMSEFGDGYSSAAPSQASTPLGVVSVAPVTTATTMAAPPTATSIAPATSTSTVAGSKFCDAPNMEAAPGTKLTARSSGVEECVNGSWVPLSTLLKNAPAVGSARHDAYQYWFIQQPGKDIIVVRWVTSSPTP